MAESGMLRFVCTDRGRHPSREIALVDRLRDDDPMIVIPSDRLGFFEERPGKAGQVRSRYVQRNDGRGEYLSDITWVLNCPTCRLNIEWKDDRAVRIVDDLLRSKQFQRVPVDLSALPANLK